MTTNISKKIPLPKHIGFVPDGSKTWAVKQKLPPRKGYYEAMKVVRGMALSSIKSGVRYVSFFLFSIDDWKRPKNEIEYRLKLLRLFLEKNGEDFKTQGIKLLFVGSRDGLPKDTLSALDKAVKLTQAGRAGTIVLCVNYSGQQEIIDATKKMLRHNNDPRRLSLREFETYLYEPQVPPVDLIVRTSGEYMTSGFMLWRAALAEYVFVDKLWPDFSRQDLKTVLVYYARKQAAKK